MARRIPWMRDYDKALARERALEAKVAKKARGSRVFAVLPWRGDARYSGEDVIRWFRSRTSADGYALGIGDGRGLVVREWTDIRHPDAVPRTRNAGDLAFEISEAIRAYR